MITPYAVAPRGPSFLRSTLGSLWPRSTRVIAVPHSPPTSRTAPATNAVGIADRGGTVGGATSRKLAKTGTMSAGL